MMTSGFILFENFQKFHIEFQITQCLLCLLIVAFISIFNHANMRLPQWLDKTLRKVIVTPDMHRVHHSVILSESQKNYGFNFSFWDRLFRTYQAQPVKGQLGMTLGLANAQIDSTQNLIWSLIFPFRRNP